jgi:hypothetical protein
MIAFVFSAASAAILLRFLRLIVNRGITTLFLTFSRLCQFNVVIETSL